MYVSVVTCPASADIVNGTKDSNEATIGTIVTYTCTTGYWVLGTTSLSQKVVCQEVLTWSGNVLDCQGTVY